MSSDTSRFGPRLYGLFDDVEDELSVENAAMTTARRSMRSSTGCD